MKSLLLQNTYFKKEHIEYIDKYLYRSQDLIKGRIIKLTKTHIYFDIGFKSPSKTTLEKFVKEYFRTFLLTRSVYKKGLNQKEAFKYFLKCIKLGSEFNFIAHELIAPNSKSFIDFDLTYNYISEAKLFFKLNFIKTNKGLIKGYILNNINGGFSVDIGGLVAFLPNKEVKNKLFKNKVDFLRKKNLIMHTTMNFHVSQINIERKNIVVTLPSSNKNNKEVLRIKGLEPLRASSLESKPSMSTNSIISAKNKKRK